jgi:hypothetical protein
MVKLKEPKGKQISAGTSYPGSGMCRDAMVVERFHELLNEMEMLKLSLLSLTTHYAQTQFRHRQIAEVSWTKKKNLLSVQ